jgi:hypothetical protein
LAALFLATPAVASAQTDAGSIAGTVRDSTGSVLPGVTVEASSPVLIERVRTVQTNGEGQYKIIELRPGTYTVSFTLQGFNAVRREGIELTSGFTATINADLKVGNVSETITVTGESPLIDVQNTKQQVVLTRDVIDAVPTGKSFQNLGVLIPGIVGGQVVGSTVSQDVGGQSGQNFMTMAIHGGRQTDQRIEVDGMSMSAWTRPDSSAVMFTDGNFQEYAIDVAGKSAESETGGVRINMIPREGGNTFKGSLFANFGSSRLQSSNITDELRQKGLGAANRLKSLWSINPTIGGPIAQNRLWFFGTFTYQVADQYVANSYINKNPTAWLFEPDLTQQAIDDQYARDVSGRVTWQVTPRNKVTGYYSYNFACHCHFLIGPALAGTPVTSDGSVFLHIPNYVHQATWSSPVTSRLLFEAGGSYILEDQQFNPRPESTAPRINDTGFNISYRANASNMGAYTPVYGGRGSASYVTGSHALKVGFNLIMGEYENTNRLVGNLQYTALNGVPQSVEYRGTPVVAVNRVRPNLGLFAQEQWSMKRLTVNAGLRLDYFRADFPDQNVPATQFVPVPRSFPGQEAVNWKDLNPRFGIAYDLFGNGKTAVKASANRYVIGEGIGRASSLNPILSNNTMLRTWTDSNNDRIVQGDPLNPALNLELGPSMNLNFGKPVTGIRYDPEWAKGFGKRPYNWEFSGGVQQQLLPRLSVGLSYFRRIYGNFSVQDNLAVTAADFDPYCVTIPTDPRLSSSGQRLCGLFDRALAKVGLTDSYVTAASNYGEQLDHWNGVDITMSARMAKLLLQGGVSTGKTVTDNCEIVTKFPQVSVASAAGSPALASSIATSTEFCHAETPFLSQVKLLSAYTLPLGIQLSGTFQSVPGQQITASSTYTRAQITPELGRQLSTASATINLLAPGLLYGERLNQIDLRFTKSFTRKERRLQANIDLYNALNGNTVLTLSNTYGATTGAATGSAWQVPQAILPGRIVKFGLQLNF